MNIIIRQGLVVFKPLPLRDQMLIQRDTILVITVEAGLVVASGSNRLVPSGSLENVDGVLD